jgi:hypothetical protein
LAEIWVISAPARWLVPSEADPSPRLTPRKACSALPEAISWEAMLLASFAGIAKPMPKLPLCPLVP